MIVVYFIMLFEIGNGMPKKVMLNNQFLQFNNEVSCKNRLQEILKNNSNLIDGGYCLKVNVRG